MLPDAFIGGLEFRVLCTSSHSILDGYQLHLTDEETDAQGG